MPFRCSPGYGDRRTGPGELAIGRLRPSGSPGETDVFGAQQYAPLFEVQVP